MATRKKGAKKKAAKKKPSASASPAAGSGADRVRVRMYRQGLGDCFLLSFGTGASAKHVLIDCGTLGATTTGVTMSEVAGNILEETGGKLALLIATHEHHDHVSGFNSQKAKFDTLKVAHVWMAWTENPADKLAQRVAKWKKDVGAALVAAMPVLRAAAPGTAAARTADAVSGMLAWFGNDEHPLGAGKFSETVDVAMKYVRDKDGAKAEFLKPGDLREESWLPGWRVYVLGPPYSESKLADTGEKGSADLYSLASGLRSAAEFAASARQRYSTFAVGEQDREERARFESQLPFAPRFRSELNDQEARARTLAAYDDPRVAWRRIDSDWLGSASDLALQLDNITNNTSLALAFERISDGKVLLFPADAQEGNWLSWHDPAMKWEVPGPGGGAKRTVRTVDLLERTVFYKVGHHGSHNATASRRGLELMKSDELVAFVPVDRAVALTRNPQGSWKMPARALYRRLLEKCNGRVVRSDIGWAADPAKAKSKATEKEFVGMASAAEWKKWGEEQGQAQARKRIVDSERWIDCALE